MVIILAPEEDIRHAIKVYFDMGMNDLEICSNMEDHYDTALHGLGVVSLRNLRRKWGFQRTRQQKHTFQSISDAVRQIRVHFPFRGAETIKKNLRQMHGMHVSRKLVSNFLKVVEPQAVKARKGRRFKRKRYWAAGVNDAWPQDQHDKWKRFGLFLHQSCDAYSGSFNWVKIWWTNSNPRLIAKWFLDACREHGGVPLISQSDPGSENYGVANAQTKIRHRLDPSLIATIQHRWMRRHQNILSEIKWLILRRDWSPGFEDVFDRGVNEGWYDVNDILMKYTLCSLLFRWLAIPWMQVELDIWMAHRNHSKPRADKHKILPHGIPDIIRAKPQRYGSYDFKVVVPKELFDEVEQLYAPPDHLVFQLVPPEFHARASELYAMIGQPVVGRESFWDIYRHLLFLLQNPQEVHLMTPILTAHRDTIRRLEQEEDMPLIPNLQEFKNPPGLMGPPEAAEFTSDEEQEDAGDSEDDF
ncbi:hypothetical protein FIBSPDRAFT_912633 [Athelia psychrophila]|uniref:Integrase catalytic domain-containing protein n=1 Tax=Athelia psychrophila TaxID=1759441 RepID=A0A166DXP4_9AGAM|nr:hypothetical protein FIBSPDRAFT_912633 [Fibularhizoctonia sp. CBS 109695]